MEEPITEQQTNLKEDDQVELNPDDIEDETLLISPLEGLLGAFEQLKEDIGYGATKFDIEQLRDWAYEMEKENTALRKHAQDAIEAAYTLKEENAALVEELTPLKMDSMVSAAQQLTDVAFEYNDELLKSKVAEAEAIIAQVGELQERVAELEEENAALLENLNQSRQNFQQLQALQHIDGDRSIIPGSSELAISNDKAEQSISLVLNVAKGDSMLASNENRDEDSANHVPVATAATTPRTLSSTIAGPSPEPSPRVDSTPTTTPARPKTDVLTTPGTVGKNPLAVADALAVVAGSSEGGVAASAARMLREYAVVNEKLDAERKEKENLQKEVNELTEVMTAKTFKAPSAWAEREVKYKQDKRRWEEEKRQAEMETEVLREEVDKLRTTTGATQLERRIEELEARLLDSERNRDAARAALHEAQIASRATAGEFSATGVKPYQGPRVSQEGDVHSVVEIIESSGGTPRRSPRQQSPSASEAVSFGGHDAADSVQLATQLATVQRENVRLRAQLEKAGPGSTPLETPQAVRDALSNSSIKQANDIRQQLAQTKQEKQALEEELLLLKKEATHDNPSEVNMMFNLQNPDLIREPSLNMSFNLQDAPPPAAAAEEATNAAADQPVNMTFNVQNSDVVPEKVNMTFNIQDGGGAHAASEPPINLRFDLKEAEQKTEISLLLRGVDTNAAQEIAALEAKLQEARYLEQAALVKLQDTRAALDAAAAAAQSAEEDAAKDGDIETILKEREVLEAEVHRVQEEQETIKEQVKEAAALLLPPMPLIAPVGGQSRSTSPLFLDEILSEAPLAHEQRVAEKGESQLGKSENVSTMISPTAEARIQELQARLEAAQAEANKRGGVSFAAVALEVSGDLTEKEQRINELETRLAEMKLKEDRLQSDLQGLAQPIKLNFAIAAGGDDVMASPGTAISRQSSETSLNYNAESLAKDRAEAEAAWENHLKSSDVSSLLRTKAELETKVQMMQAHLDKMQASLAAADREKGMVQDSIDKAITSGDVGLLSGLRDSLRGSAKMMQGSKFGQVFKRKKAVTQQEIKTALHDTQEALQETEVERNALRRQLARMTKKMDKLSPRRASIPEAAGGSGEVPKEGLPIAGTAAAMAAAAAAAAEAGGIIEGEASVEWEGQSVAAMSEEESQKFLEDVEVELAALRDENQLIMDHLVTTKVQLAEVQGDFLESRRALLRSREKQMQMAQQLVALQAEKSVENVVGGVDTAAGTSPPKGEERRRSLLNLLSG